MNTFALLTLTFAVGAPNLKDLPPKMPSIIGEWVRVGHTQAGQPVGADRETHRQVFKADGEWEYYYADRKGTDARYTFATDSRQNPPTIDILLNRTGAGGWRGIYKIEKDTLTLCLVNTPGERPKTFESSADQPTTVWVFNRVTPKE